MPGDLAGAALSRALRIKVNTAGPAAVETSTESRHRQAIDA